MAKSAANPGGIAAKARALAAPYAEELGLRLWDVRFLKEGVTWYLRLWIDKPGGVTLDDCEAMSRAIDQPLDDGLFIEQSYCLEVCSPGIERELTREEHFLQYLGSGVTLRLVRPLEGEDESPWTGRRELSGVLEAFEGNRLTLRLEDGAALNFAKKETASVRLTENSKIQ
ncbi:MAG: ribosome maturation factor RimP [Oscillospiraceae bacterium]|nr:ribosome maturation factor RimP [Oscillospiraceae bacterium]